MKPKELKLAQKKLVNFVETFKTSFGRSERRHWCRLYLSGLLLEGERKSIQPMAERLPGGNEQALQQFVNQSPWDHQDLQYQLAHYLARYLKPKRGILVLDDTSLPKKGSASVGVSPQYCGALGKIANCQSIVTWHYAPHQGTHFPLIAELFLPQNRIDRTDALQRCGVPARRFAFKKKWELAIALLQHIPKTLPYEVIVFDAGYGECREFLRYCDKQALTFVAQIPESHSYWPIDIDVITEQPKTGRPRRYAAVADKSKKPLSAKNWRIRLEQEQPTWKKIKLGLASKPSTEVKIVRVREVTTQAYYRPGNERWLLIEKVGKASYKYYLSNAPAETTLKTLVLWAHERWKIEQGYQHLKEELGLDHFEGRSWRGLHHHITLCLMAYAFLLLLKQGVKKTLN